MLSAVKKIDISAGVIIPKPLLAEFGVATGDSVELKVEAGRIVIERVTNPPRKGWAEDAKRLPPPRTTRLNGRNLATKRTSR